MERQTHERSYTCEAHTYIQVVEKDNCSKGSMQRAWAHRVSRGGGGAGVSKHGRCLSKEQTEKNLTDRGCEKEGEADHDTSTTNHDVIKLAR